MRCATLLRVLAVWALVWAVVLPMRRAQAGAPAACKAAVVVGISEYPSEVEKLSFAAEDAIQFASFLLKQEPEQRVILLTRLSKTQMKEIGGGDPFEAPTLAFDEIEAFAKAWEPRWLDPVSAVVRGAEESLLPESGNARILVGLPTDARLHWALQTGVQAVCGGAPPTEVIFYYAGHGAVKDAPREQWLRLLSSEWGGSQVTGTIDVSLHDIVSVVRDSAPGAQFVVITDACQTGVSARAIATMQERPGLNPFLPNPKVNEVFLSATSPYAVAADGGPYLDSLREAFGTPEADLNCDGLVSFVEAHLFTGETLSRTEASSPQDVSWRWSSPLGGPGYPLPTGTLEGRANSDVGAPGVAPACAPHGYLRFVKRDYSARVLPAGEGALGGPETVQIEGLLQIGVGEHVVEFYRAGLLEYSDTIRVRPGEVTSLDEVLARETDPGRGRVQVGVSAEVFHLLAPGQDAPPDALLPAVYYPDAPVFMGVSARWFPPRQTLDRGRYSLGGAFRAAPGWTQEGDLPAWSGVEVGWWYIPGRYRGSDWRRENPEWLIGATFNADVPMGYDEQAEQFGFDTSSARLGLGPALNFSVGAVAVGVELQPLSLVVANQSSDFNLGYSFPLRLCVGMRL